MKNKEPKKEFSKDSIVPDPDSFAYDEKHGISSFLLKQDNEFYNEEDNIPGKLIRVKKMSKPEEGWKILVDGKEYLLIKSSRFSKQEKEFLRTEQGFQFIIDGVKQGWNSISEFKRKLEGIL